MFVLKIFLHPRKMLLFCVIQSIFPCLMYTITYSVYMYAVFVHLDRKGKHITYSNEVLSAKHVYSYRWAGWVNSFSTILYSLCVESTF